MPEALGELIILAVTGSGLEVSGAVVGGFTVAAIVGNVPLATSARGLRFALDDTPIRNTISETFEVEQS